ncbi:MAG: Gfo/Idh/MocA family oxidoreductase [Gammaproteobacteria bacterium]|nr:Gfo/Idh/MocA family oxidoreductase [Gammaproteobacteria bacterium]MDH3431350.1 Gfo/Idh/MocA family oxidoreductase [Gammaproteobacteria bacterium]MDH3433250.1 Gfo/Idh/MocA family oxidoreductase [Gammaproteobacteria bacterium]
MNKIRWGIVSAGTIANTFASDVAHAANAELAAVAARSLPSAAGFADKYGIDRVYEGYDALFADPDIDAIYVATPHTLHLKNSADALRAGKAVLCEKPITTSAAECQELLNIAAETGGYLMEAMWTWFLPAMQKAKVWFEAGRIGELRHVKADFGYPKRYDPDDRVFNASLAGGCLLDMGIYPIAIARFFARQTPTDIKVISHHAPNGVDDDVVMLFNYDKLVATLATSFRCKLQNTAYIIGDKGYIAIPNCWRASECHLFELDTCIDSFSDDRSGSGFEFQITAVSDDILQGRKESAVVTHAASLAFQQDMDRVRSQF